MTNIASPIADSAAATVKTNNANNWPKISSKKTEKIMKLKLIDNNINSMDINKIIIFFRFKKIPERPNKNNTMATNKYLV